MADGATTGRGVLPAARFAATKFRPPTLPATLTTRPELHDRLIAGADKRLTVVVGSAGAGKSVLLSSWTAARAPRVTAWLSCDGGDANPARFWSGFIHAPQTLAPGFGADAAELLAMDGEVSADVTASIASDAAQLPAGSAVVIDDFQYAAPAVAETMTDLIELWPADTAQLVLSTRFDPPLRLHRLRMARELCELRSHDLYFSLADSRDLLAKFGVDVTPADLALLHERSEGWAAALQMVALSLRGAQDPAQAARALQIRGNAIADYFVSEVLDRQPPEIARFMLDTSILGELTAEACAAVTGRPDAGALLHGIDTGDLFLIALDEERTSFRYHHLVRQVLRTELKARDQTREQELQLRAAEWFESTNDVHRAVRYFFAARQADRALTLLQDRVVSEYLHNPALPPPPDPGVVDPALAADAPDRLLALTFEMLLAGDMARSREYLDLLERTWPSIPPDPRRAARLAVVRAARHMGTGQAAETVREALAAQAIQEQEQFRDDWVAAIPIILFQAYSWLEDYEAVERVAAAALLTPDLSEPAKLVMVPGAQALAWFECGQLAKAADAARTAEAQARKLGFDQHTWTVNHLRTLSGLALEQRDLDTAERLAEQALLISERRRPCFEFLAMLDRAAIWAARGQAREALATIDQARLVLAGTGSELLARADELEAVLRLSLGDLRVPAELANRLPAVRQALLMARVALAAGDHQAAQAHLESSSLGSLTPRRRLIRQLLLAAVAIGRSDPLAASIMADALQTTRHEGFLNTVVTTAPEVTGYLVEHSAQAHADPFTEQVATAALQVRAAQRDTSGPRRGIIEPLSAAELRILTLLPTSSYVQMADTFYISRNTVKAHLRAIYRKLGVTSRSDAIKRAVELQLL